MSNEQSAPVAAVLAVRNLAQLVELGKQLVSQQGFGFPIQDVEPFLSNTSKMSLWMATEAVLYELGKLERGKLAPAATVADFLNATFPTGKKDESGKAIDLVTLYVNKADAERSVYYFGGLPMFQTIRNEAAALATAAVTNLRLNPNYRSFRGGRNGSGQSTAPQTKAADTSVTSANC